MRERRAKKRCTKPVLLVVSLAVLTGIGIPAAAQGNSSDEGCLPIPDPSILATMDRSAALQELHRGLDCPLVRQQHGLQAAIWDSVGQLSVAQPPADSLPVARGVIQMTAMIVALGERLEAEVTWAATLDLLEETTLQKRTLEGQRTGHLSSISPATAQTGVAVLEELARVIATWYATAGSDGHWKDGSPLSEGERIASLRLAAQAFTVAGLYAFASTLQADWVQSEAPYRADLDRVDRIEAAIQSHAEQWRTIEAGWLAALFWYGASVPLEHELAWALATLDGYGEPRAATLGTIGVEFATAQRDAGRLVSQLFLIVGIVALATTLFVARAQTRWARDYHEMGLGAELVWRNIR